MACAGSGTAAAPSANKLSLPLYEESLVIPRPVLPARMDGECPGIDQCEFGKEWRTCEAIPLYSEAAEGSPVLRRLKAMETFIAEGGEIELIAPGQIEITDVTYPHQTGGYYLDPGAKLEVYGPLHDSRALYFNPASGRAFSPPANEDHWWWDRKNAKMTVAPKMTWWVRARMKDGARGWLKLRSVEDIDGFPNYHHQETLEAWDIHRLRDDETPGCAEMLEDRDRPDATN
ncbi:MAG: hypothetical protein ABIS23_05260 [Sphingomicrobium sp.]